MAGVEDLAKESFGKDCIVEKNAQFLSIYRGDTKMALINLIKHRMILCSKDFLDNAEAFSEGYRKIVPDAENFLVFASYN